MSMNTGPANVRELCICCSDTWIPASDDWIGVNKSYVFTFPGHDLLMLSPAESRPGPVWMQHQPKQG